MDEPDRGALMLVRFIAVTLLGLGFAEVALYWAEYMFHREPLKISHCLEVAVPFVSGVVILIKAKAVAGWLSDKLE